MAPFIVKRYRVFREFLWSMRLKEVDMLILNLPSVILVKRHFVVVNDENAPCKKYTTMLDVQNLALQPPWHSRYPLASIQSVFSNMLHWVELLYCMQGHAKQGFARNSMNLVILHNCLLRYIIYLLLSYTGVPTDVIVYLLWLH